MPPKKPGSKKGRKVAAPYSPVDEIKNMQEIDETLAKAQQLRNYFQVERDKVNQLWEISKKELSNEEFHLTNLASELEEAERDHQVEMKVYKQKVRHLLYDQRVALKQLKDDSDVALQQAEATHEKKMTQIAAENEKLHSSVQSAICENESYIADQRDTHQYMISVTKRQSHEKELSRLKSSYEDKIRDLREDLELRRRAELNEIEQRWNDHINQIIEQHETKFAEMKSYYNSITKNNLEIIQSLKEEIATMKKNDEHNENLMYDIEKENHNLAAPLAVAEKDVADLQLKKKQYLQDKQSLSLTGARFRALREDLRKLRVDHATLEQNYQSVFAEREELRGKFESSLRDAMDIVDERNAVLQQNLLEANACVEEREAQVDGVLRAMNMEPATMRIVGEQIQKDLAVKNQIIKDMYYELRKLESKSSAVLTEYERRCRDVSLPPLSRENFVQA